jgi:hypothetical protein
MNTKKSFNPKRSCISDENNNHSPIESDLKKRLYEIKWSNMPNKSEINYKISPKYHDEKHMNKNNLALTNQMSGLDFVEVHDGNEICKNTVGVNEGSCIGGCRGCDIDYYPIQNNDNLRKQLILKKNKSLTSPSSLSFPSSPSSSISPSTDNFEQTIKINREREKEREEGRCDEGREDKESPNMKEDLVNVCLYM